MGRETTTSENLTLKKNPALDALTSKATAGNNPAVGSLLSDYGSGKISLQDALAGARNISGSNAGRDAIKQQLIQEGNTLRGADLDRAVDSIYKSRGGADTPSENSIMQLLATDPASAQRYASEQVRNDPLTRGLLGEGGLQDKSLGQVDKLTSNLDESRNALMGRDQSYGLTNQDLQAYGQASGDITRLFGQQEQGLAQSLADRGLSAAPSGAAGVAFSGLQGNKMEQLARLQSDIADKRIQTAKGLAESRMQSDLQRQSINNNLLQGLGQLGQTALSGAYNRNLAGRQQSGNELAQASGQQMQNIGMQQNQANTEWEQRQKTKGPGIGDVLGAIGGGLLGAATGGIGTALGAGLGKSVGGLFGGGGDDEAPTKMAKGSSALTAASK